MTMRVGVVGGTGTLGALVVAELSRRGHEVYALTRRAPQKSGQVAHRRVDLTTGEGLAEALSGLEVVVDASNASGMGRTMRAVLVDGTVWLLHAEAQAGVAHHVLVSIVGIEDLPMSYYRIKLEQEQALAAGSIASSVLRSTQFHPLVASMLGSAARFGIVPTGRALLQPVDPLEVARLLGERLTTEPWGERLEVGGPEILSLSELARVWRRTLRRRAIPVPVPLPGRIGRALRAGALISRDGIRRDGTFGSWLRGDDERGDLKSELRGNAMP